ncbi:MAG: UDP-N-acetylglucosamine 2-epimerase [Candidatus Methanoperedens sp.]|nr:UDP-N-acetylglucosamine 2-epimerase [Candidatus Methanoperedens sp.]
MRHETVKVGSNILAGADPNRILRCAELMLTKKKGWKNPFGDEKAGKRVMEILITDRVKEGKEIWEKS